MEVKKLRAIIIEDNPGSMNELVRMIKDHTPEVEVIDTCEWVAEGIELIDKLKPDLVFLDIEIKGGYGLEVIKKASFKDFFTIVTTSYEKYTLDAFDISAIDYILKPVTSDDLTDAINKIKRITNITRQYEKYDFLINELSHPSGKIVLSASDCHIIVKFDEILRFEVHHNLTTCYLKDGRTITMAKTLKYFEELLENKGFFRIHNNHLVNLNYIGRYNRREKSIKMEDKTCLPISRQSLPYFKKIYKSFWRIKSWF